MKELKPSEWGIKVDKSEAKETYPLRGTVFPKGSGMNLGNINSSSWRSIHDPKGDMHGSNVSHNLDMGSTKDVSGKDAK